MTPAEIMARTKIADYEDPDLEWEINGEFYLQEAQVDITALEKEGYVIVPRKPDLTMLIAAMVGVTNVQILEVSNESMKTIKRIAETHKNALGRLAKK